MQRTVKQSRNEIIVSFSRYDIIQFKKNWSCFNFRPKKLVFIYDATTLKLKLKNFEDDEIGNLNAAVSLHERAKRIAKF